MSIYCVLRWMILFPDEVPEQRRLPRQLAWVALIFPLARASYFFGGPVPSWLVPVLVLLSDVLIIATALSILTLNFMHADAHGRRRVKWVLFGAYLAGVPVVLNLVAESVFGLGAGRFDVLLELNVFMAAVMPIGILIAILRYQLFDIDRVISMTASYSVLVVLVVVGEETVVPQIARALGAVLGLEPESSETPLSALMAVAAIPAHHWLRPQIDRLFFAQRYSVETGMGELLARVSGYSDVRTLTETFGAELHRLMQVDACAIYALSGELYTSVFSEGLEGPPSFEADGTLVGVIQRHAGALALTAGRHAHGGAATDPFERAALETLAAEVVVPVKQRDSLTAFLCLGAERSGDVYTPADLALLVAAAEKYSAESVYLALEANRSMVAPALPVSVEEHP